MEYTPEILRNNGVPVEVADVIHIDGDWPLQYTPEGELKTETIYIKFTHNIIADIEELWGGLEVWQEQMQSKPVSTLRRILSLIEKEPIEVTGARMIDGRLPEYSNAIGVAWAMANGVNPEIASQLLKEAEIGVGSQIEMLNQELKENLNLDGTTPGQKPSQPGAKQDKDTETSGKPAQPKS